MERLQALSRQTVREGALEDKQAVEVHQRLLADAVWVMVRVHSADRSAGSGAGPRIHTVAAETYGPRLLPRIIAFEPLIGDRAPENKA